jgi:hypothetical protein
VPRYNWNIVESGVKHHEHKSHILVPVSILKTEWTTSCTNLTLKGACVIEWSKNYGKKTVIEWDQFSEKCGQNRIGKIFFIYLT